MFNAVSDKGSASAIFKQGLKSVSISLFSHSKVIFSFWAIKSNIQDNITTEFEAICSRSNPRSPTVEEEMDQVVEIVNII